MATQGSVNNQNKNEKAPEEKPVEKAAEKPPEKPPEKTEKKESILAPLIEARVAAGRSVQLSATETVRAGGIVKLPRKDIDELREKGFVVDLRVDVIDDGVDAAPSMKQSTAEAVTVTQPKDGRPSMTTKNSDSQSGTGLPSFITNRS